MGAGRRERGALSGGQGPEGSLPRPTHRHTAGGAAADGPFLAPLIDDLLTG